MALRRLAGHGGLEPGLGRIHPGFEQPLKILDLETGADLVVDQLHNVFFDQGQKLASIDFLKKRRDNHH